MRIYELPFEFERSAKKDLRTAISARELQADSRIDNSRKLAKSIKYEHAQEELTHILKKPTWAGVSILCPLGVVGGLIACTCISCSGDWRASGIGGGFLTLIFGIVISTALGLIIDFTAHKVWNRAWDNKVQEMNEKLHKIDNSIECEMRNRDEYIKKVTHECEIECQKYTEAFEESAQEMSVQYVGSPLAQSVISWMTNGFYCAIDAADRRPHIDLIKVPFVFDVYAYKITCNLGTFDFELQRCRNLNSPLEQAALARAIAASIQLDVVKKYPQDVTGSPVDVGISFSYAQGRPIVTVTYVAQNFNYKPVSDWGGDRE